MAEDDPTIDRPASAGALGAPLTLRIVGDAPTYQLGIFGPVLLQRIRSTPPVEYLSACNLAETEIYEAAPERYCSIVVIERAASLPDARFRSGAMDLWRTYGDRMRAQSIVLAGEGFWASAIRAALTGILSVGGRQVRRKVTSTVGEGVAFLTRPAQLSAGEGVALTRAIEELRGST